MYVCVYIPCWNHIKNFSPEKTFIINFPQYFSLVVNSEMILCVCVVAAATDDAAAVVGFFSFYFAAAALSSYRLLSNPFSLSILLRLSVWCVNFQCIWRKIAFVFLHWFNAVKCSECCLVITKKWIEWMNKRTKEPSRRREAREEDAKTHIM